jgi:hypothetical protein
MDQTDAWGNAIVYRLRDDGSRVLYSVGADGQADTQDDIVAEDADR